MTAIDQRAREAPELIINQGNETVLRSDFTAGVPAGLQVRLRRKSSAEYAGEAFWPTVSTSGNIVTQTYSPTQVEHIASYGSFVREYWWYKPGSTGVRKCYVQGNISVRLDTSGETVAGETVVVDPDTGTVSEPINVIDLTIQDIIDDIQNTLDSRIYFISEVTNGIRLGCGPTAQVTETTSPYGPAITITI